MGPDIWAPTTVLVKRSFKFGVLSMKKYKVFNYNDP